MTELEYKAIRERLSVGSKLEPSESFEFARACANLLCDLDQESKGRDLIIRALEVAERFPPETKEIWNDLVEAAGLHPYVRRETLATAAALRHEFHHSQFLPGYYLHREQQELSARLIQGESLVLSAPTSFGKSLLIEEVVASRRYGNIVVIQPTLALLDETRKKLSKYGNHYSIVVSTHQEPGESANLFLFTAERVVEYDKLPSIDFFVIDEFYKLSLDRDDERAIVLNQALYTLLKHTSRFYLLGPNIRTISKQFVEEFGATWRHSEYATVAVDVEQVFKDRGWAKNDERRREELFRLVSELDGPTIVYCASPQKADGLAQAFVKYLENGPQAKHWQDIGKGNQSIVEWISENIHREWVLAEALKFGVAAHHGHLPRHLGSAIVDAFNERSIRCLFCTSTLIEGVNTAARNVVLYDQQKGRKPIDFFDYKNIVGRSGRMKIHYVGRVYEFHREPKQSELDVDVPLFDQSNAPLELLVQLDRDDVRSEGKRRLEIVDRQEEALQEIIRKNSGISVEGQIEFVKEIQRSTAQYHPLLKWTSMPNYPELESVLELCWRFLLRSTESKAGVRTHRQLAMMTIQYCQGKSLRHLIVHALQSPFWTEREPDPYARVQAVVSLTLGVARQWFDFKLPKILAAASELQAYVFNRAGLRPGNYAYMSAALENSFFKGLLSVLLDYDVPASAVRKLERLFSANDDWTAIERKLRTTRLQDYGLLPYEIEKLRSALGLARQRRS